MEILKSAHLESVGAVYCYQAYLLGIKPVEPGFKTFIIDPTGIVVDKAEGNVSTPFGPIRLAWERSKQGMVYRLTHPSAIRAEVTNLDDRYKLVVIKN